MSLFGSASAYIEMKKVFAMQIFRLAVYYYQLLVHIFGPLVMYVIAPSLFVLNKWYYSLIDFPYSVQSLSILKLVFRMPIVRFK